MLLLTLAPGRLAPWVARRPSELPVLREKRVRDIPITIRSESQSVDLSGRVELAGNVRVTTCKHESPHWEIGADQVTRLGDDPDQLHLTHGKLFWNSKKILSMPGNYIFSLRDQASGIIIPQVRFDSDYGPGIKIGFYHGPSRFYDSTLTAQVLSNQGEVLSHEIRIAQDRLHALTFKWAAARDRRDLPPILFNTDAGPAELTPRTRDWGVTLNGLWNLGSSTLSLAYTGGSDQQIWGNYFSRTLFFDQHQQNHLVLSCSGVNQAGSFGITHERLVRQAPTEERAALGSCTLNFVRAHKLTLPYWYCDTGVFTLPGNITWRNECEGGLVHERVCAGVGSKNGHFMFINTAGTVERLVSLNPWGGGRSTQRIRPYYQYDVMGVYSGSNTGTISSSGALGCDWFGPFSYNWGWSFQPDGRIEYRHGLRGRFGGTARCQYAQYGFVCRAYQELIDQPRARVREKRRAPLVLSGTFYHPYIRGTSRMVYDFKSRKKIEQSYQLTCTIPHSTRKAGLVLLDTLRHEPAAWERLSYDDRVEARIISRAIAGEQAGYTRLTCSYKKLDAQEARARNLWWRDGAIISLGGETRIGTLGVNLSGSWAEEVGRTQQTGWRIGLSYHQDCYSLTAGYQVRYAREVTGKNKQHFFSVMLTINRLGSLGTRLR